jgi:hypothetical protein
LDRKYAYLSSNIIKTGFQFKYDVTYKNAQEDDRKGLSFEILVPLQFTFSSSINLKTSYRMKVSGLYNILMLEQVLSFQGELAIRTSEWLLGTSLV